MPKILDISVEDIFEIENHGTVLTYRPASQQEVDHLVKGNIIRVRYRDEKETTLWEVQGTEWFEIMDGRRGQNISISVKPVKKETMEMDYSKKIVLLLKGLPRSGKSTIAKRLVKHNGWAIINPDSFRLAIHGQAYYAPAESLVWANVKIAARALLLAGHTHIVVDATNMTRRARDEWRHENWRVFVYELKTDMETCLKNAERTGREDLIPVIERMDAEHQPLEPDEETFRSLPLPCAEFELVLGDKFPKKEDETPE